MRTRCLALALALLAVPAAGCLQQTGPGSSETVQDDFETGIDAWNPRADVPEDPNREDQDVAWDIVPSDEVARSGDWSVAFQLDGLQDDGTIWLERPFQIEADQAYRANVSLWAHSENESFNQRAHLVMHVGHEAPEAEEDFPAPGEATNASSQAPTGGLRLPLDRAQGWSEYTFEWPVPPAEEREDRALYVAFGISAVWETELEYHVDDLKITLTRMPADEPSEA